MRGGVSGVWKGGRGVGVGVSEGLEGRGEYHIALLD